MLHLFLHRGIARGRSGTWAPLHLQLTPPWAPKMKWHFAGVYGELPFWVLVSFPLSSPCRPSFWKVWLHPCFYTIFLGFKRPLIYAYKSQSALDLHCSVKRWVLDTSLTYISIWMCNTKDINTSETSGLKTDISYVWFVPVIWTISPVIKVSMIIDIYISTKVVLNVTGMYTEHFILSFVRNNLKLLTLLL